MTMKPTRPTPMVEAPEPTELLIEEARRRARRRRLTVLTVALVVAVVAVTGLFVGERSIAPTPGATFATPAANVVGGPLCTAGALTTQLGRGSAALGTSYQTLEMVNHSAVACSLSGTPKAQAGLLTHSGSHLSFRPVGPHAQALTFSSVKRGAPIVLRHGTLASVTFGIETAADYVPTQCEPSAINAVRLIFQRGAEQTTLYYGLGKSAACTKVASTSIAGVVLGTRFP